MTLPLPTRRVWVLAVLALLLATDPLLRGEQLPVRFFTTTDGLAGDGILSILQDLGFLWIGTRTGLNRFDGKLFRNYCRAEPWGADLGVSGASIACVRATSRPELVTA